MYIETLPIDDIVMEATAQVSLPQEMVEHFAMRSIRAMCATRYLHDTITIDIQAGVNDYHLPDYIPDKWEIINVRWAESCGSCVVFDSNCQKHCRGGLLAQMTSDLTFQLHDPPQCDIKDGLTVSISLRPSAKSCVVPSSLIPEYEDAILSGIYARAYLLPAEVFYNPRTASIHAGIHSAGISNLRIKSLHNNTNNIIIATGERII